MMSWKVWLSVVVSTILYILLVKTIGFTGIVANSINFSRVMISVAVLTLFVPWLGKLFRMVPAPRRDYLLAGIILTWASSLLFANWNEAGRVFGVSTSIFQSPIAGFFSLLLVTGGVFHFIAPDTANRRLRIIAVALGLIYASMLVFVAPLFR